MMKATRESLDRLNLSENPAPGEYNTTFMKKNAHNILFTKAIRD